MSKKEVERNSLIIKMHDKGMTFREIADMLSTPEKRISFQRVAIICKRDKGGKGG